MFFFSDIIKVILLCFLLENIMLLSYDKLYSNGCGEQKNVKIQLKFM